MKNLFVSLFVLAYSCASPEVKLPFYVAPKGNHGPEYFHDTDDSLGVTGGNFASEGQFPWQAYLFIISNAILNGKPNGQDNYSECGASLISAQHLITAAHCLRIYNFYTKIESVARKVHVKLGSVTKTRYGMKIVTKSFVIHPSWNARDPFIRNDIAILYLPVAVKLDPRSIYPISLPTSPEGFVEENATASGFGATNNAQKGKRNVVLNYVQLQVLSNQDCKKQIPDVDDSQLCANNLDSYGRPGHSICFGDSGGPLVVSKSVRKSGQRVDKHTLIGVASFVVESCGKYPSVFTRITHYMTFIRKHVPNV